MGVFIAVLIKIRRSAAWILAALVPSVTAVASAMGAWTSGGFEDGWNTLWIRSIGLYGMLMLGVGLSVLASLVWRAEHTGNNWNAMAAQPVAAWGLDVDISASWVWVVLTALVNAFVGVSLGLLVSAFARTEFQAVQFMPVVIAPQLFLCGLLVSRDQLPRALEVVGDALPMSWAVDAVTELTTASEPSDDFFRYLAYLICFGLVVLGVAASTVPRKTR